MRSYMCVPLICNNQLIGSLNLGSRHPGAFTANDAEVVRDIANMLAISIGHSKLHTEVMEKNYELAERNKDMTDSIKYAKEIQDGILPRADIVNAIFPESFVFYQPRDIVSGDFYWLTVKQNKAIFAVVDCTGHGVPGALMSMIGNNILNQTINVKNLVEPGQILNHVNLGLKATFSHHGKEDSIKDGMDISIISMDLGSDILKFAGAGRPLYHIQNGNLRVIKGDPYTVGLSTPPSHIFQQEEIRVKTGDLVYLFSDGFHDQFGGVRNRKFMSRRFRELLLEIHTLEMAQQEKILYETLELWRGNRPQVDDILVVGIRF